MRAGVRRYRAPVRRVVVLLLAGLVLAGGCVRPGVEGAAAPETATAVEQPPRPRVLSVEGVDPCALLTEAQRVELGLDRPPIFDSNPSPLYQGPDPACTTRGNEPRAVVVGVGLPYDGLGADAFAPERVEATVTPLRVRGFPAVQAIPARLTDFCSVIVDVAPGQALDIQYRDGGRRPPVPQDELCAGAREVADAAMTTLLTLR